jgi:DNA-binding NarL/FixJ family response regulator
LVYAAIGFGGGSNEATWMRVVIVDEQDLFRAGLRAMLESEGLDVVAEARRAEDAVAVVQRTAPDVVLLDVEAPAAVGGEATRRLTEAVPGTVVVALMETLEPGDAIDALIAGAAGCLAKAESVGARAAEVVRAAAAGETLLPGRTARALIERLREVSAARAAARAGLASLSPRELDVLRLIAEGHDNRAIGAALFISPQTVKHHVATIFDKLGVENRVQAAVHAVRAGIA